MNNLSNKFKALIGLSLLTAGLGCNACPQPRHPKYNIRNNHWPTSNCNPHTRWLTAERQDNPGLHHATHLGWNTNSADLCKSSEAWCKRMRQLTKCCALRLSCPSLVLF